jgi:SAM-dependent methyltransferase
LISGVRNLLYSRPELYEAVYHGADHAVPRMCERLFEKYLGESPSGLLDIGCGTGRDLGYFAERWSDCIGVDYQQSMVDYARRQHPGVDFRTGDMRTLRLDRTFDAITCLGYVLANIHNNEDLDRVFASFAAHSRPGALVARSDQYRRN